MLIKCPRLGTAVWGRGFEERELSWLGDLVMAAAVKWRSSDFNHNLRAAAKGFVVLVNYHSK